MPGMAISSWPSRKLRVAGAHARKEWAASDANTSSRRTPPIALRGCGRVSATRVAMALPPPGRRSIPAAMSGIRTSPDPLRPHEVATDRPLRPTPVSRSSGASARPGPIAWSARSQGRLDGPTCRIEVFGRPGSTPSTASRPLRQARGPLLAEPGPPRPRAADPARPRRPRGTFALRSPVRPNPIGPSPRPPRPPRGRRPPGPRPRLPRRHAAPRHQARPLRSHGPGPKKPDLGLGSRRPAARKRAAMTPIILGRQFRETRDPEGRTHPVASRPATPAAQTARRCRATSVPAAAISGSPGLGSVSINTRSSAASGRNRCA